MKVKFSKKLIAALMAVLMIATSLPFGGIAAMAADGDVASTDAALQEVLDQMTAFETKVTDGGEYTNTVPAYNAYVACQQAVDAYVYGGEEDALTGYAETLKNAIANIKTFTPYTATGGSDDESGKTSTYGFNYTGDSNGQGYKNGRVTRAGLLWADQNTDAMNAPSTTGSGNSSGISGKVSFLAGTHTSWTQKKYYTYFGASLTFPNQVVLYDGKTDPEFKVGIYLYNDNTNSTAGEDGYLHAIENANTSTYKLDSKWIGDYSHDKSSTWTWEWNWMYNYAASNSTGYSIANSGSDQTAGALTVVKNNGKDNGHHYLTNVVKLSDSYTPSTNPYDILDAMSFKLYASGDKNLSSAKTGTLTAGIGNEADDTSYLYVVNYKMLTDAVTSASTEMKSYDPNGTTGFVFGEGGAATYFSALDKATSIDPNSYFSADFTYTEGKTNSAGKKIANGNGVAALGEDIVSSATRQSTGVKYALSGYTPTGSTMHVERATTDSTSYQALRDAMSSSVRTTYSDGNGTTDNPTYTTDSWDAFVKAYETAQTAMAAVNDTAFTDDSSVIGDPTKIYTNKATTVTETAEDGTETTKDSTQIDDYANALTEAYKALVTNEEKVDTTELEALINATTKYADIFTADTKAALDEAIAKAYTDVWGGEDNFGVASKALTLTDANQLIVDNDLQAIKTAITNLRIDPDAMVTTNYGRHSLNEALALSVSNPDDYGNYLADFKTPYDAATTYAANLATTPITDYDTQYEEYVNYVNKIFTGYNNLLPAFLKMANGRLVRQLDQYSMDEMTSNDAGYQTMNVSYPAGATFIRTTNDSFTNNIGTLSVRFGSNIEGKNNNMLDSISINATAESVKGRVKGKDGTTGGLVTCHIPGTTNSSSSKPKSLENLTVTSQTADSDGNYPTLTTNAKEYYAGCLSYDKYVLQNKQSVYSGTFALQDLYMVGTGGNYKSSSDGGYITTSGGTRITTLDEAKKQKLDDILGTTDSYHDGTSNCGGVFVKSSSGWAYALIDGTLTYKAPEITDVITDITRANYSTIKFTNIGLSTAFGAVTTYNCQNFVNYAFYDYFTSADNTATSTNGQRLDTVVRVIDARYYVKLLEKAQDIISDADSQYKYTKDTYEAFMTAFNSANTYSEFSVDDSQIANNLQVRYRNLWDKMAALKVNTYTVTVNYMDSTGSAVADTSIVKDWGTTLTEDEINALPIPSTYETDLLVYTFTGFDPEIDYTTPIKAAVSYTATYTSEEKSANWRLYNAALDALTAKLKDDVYTATDLTALQTALEALTYVTWTTDQKAAAKADIQTAIAAETSTLTTLAANLTATDITDVSTAIATAETQAAEKNNAKDLDQYAETTVDLDYHQYVTVNGTQYYGLNYSTQEELDAAIDAALNSMAPRYYDVYLNGTKLDTFAYGTPLVVNEKGVIGENKNTDNNTGESGNYAWTYSYTAPSRDSDFGTSNHTPVTCANATEAKYMITAPSFGFILKGETYLTSTKVDSESDAHTMTIKSSINGKTIAVLVSDEYGNVTMPVAPSVAYYEFSNYSNDMKEHGVVNIEADTTVTANYTEKDNNLLTIDVAANFADGWQNLDFTRYEQYYNTTINLSYADAYCYAESWYDVDKSSYYFQVLAYGSDYSFKASHNCWTDTTSTDENQQDCIVALTQEEYNEFVEGQSTVASNLDTIPYEVTLTDGGWNGNYLVDGSGNPILKAREYDSSTGIGRAYIADPTPSVSSLGSDNVVYTADKQRFTLIGTFAGPTGYELVECGFLFTSDTTLTDLTLEKAVTTSTIARMKCSRWTVGNQFMVNIKNPATTVNYQYVPYAIFKDSTGNRTTVYGKAYTATNSGHENA